MRKDRKQKLAEERRLRRLFVNELKAKPCADCGVQYPPWVMQFDHMPGHEKTMTIGNANQGDRKAANRIYEEAKKCEVVCANCHADRSHRRRNEATNGH